MKSLFRLLPVLVIAGVLLLAGCEASRARYESASYKVVQSDGDFQIRDYPAISVVETAMGGDEERGSFGRLFRFISGRNATQEKIAMTTPVLMSDEGDGRRMAFVLPAKVVTGGAPQPADETVRLRELPPGRFAVVRFRGTRSAARETEMLERLQEWMRSRNLEPVGSPMFAYFDPPWTPGFLRRNEVMIRLAETR